MPITVKYNLRVGSASAKKVVTPIIVNSPHEYLHKDITPKIFDTNSKNKYKNTSQYW